MTSDADLDRIYHRRFGEEDARGKERVWKEIGRYLQRWVPADGRVLDVAADRGYFIRHITAAERWATDLRDVSASLGPDVRFIQVDGLSLSDAVPRDYFDVVFVSNYLEHLPNREAVIAQLVQIRGVLKHDGRLIVLQPNIRYVGAAYWDFIDHHVALTDRSLIEAATAAGFVVERLIPRFLPYTTKSRLPQSSWLVRGYLRFSPAWRVMGKQALLIARPSAGRTEPGP